MSRSTGVPPERDVSMTALWESVPHLRIRDGSVVHVSEAVTGELGHDAAPLLGALDGLGIRLDDATFADLLAGEGALRVRLGPELGDRPVRLRRLGIVGDETWVEVRSLADEFRLESLLRRSGTGHIVERELRFKANHDGLTTLPDRAALHARLESVLGQSETTQRTAVIFCDVDDFTSINDSAGHRVGDQVLTSVADRLRSGMRSADFIARVGGDEFVVIASDVTDEAGALEIAQHVFDSVTGTVRCDGIEVEVSLSIGVSVSDEETITAADLLQRSEQAMFDTKRQGRSRLAMYSIDADFGDDEQLALRDDLRTAIARGDLTLHYQPLVPLTEGLERGYESLARWDHPVHGMINAKRFLDLAEYSGLTTELGHELLRLACDDQRTWIADDDGFVSVNLSASQLSDPDAATSFLGRMLRRGVSTRHIVVELTEVALAQGSIVQRNVDIFRDAGVRILLDDFGVGHASLSQLHHFPVDGIKIDSSIINPDVDEDLVSLIVGIAATLGMRTVAEGIETSAQLDAVTRLGVDYAQGYLLGRPTRTPTSQQLP